MQTFYTVLAGTLVYVIGQCFQKFLLVPIQEQRKVRGEIAEQLLFLGNLAAHIPQSSGDGAKLVQPEDDPIIASRRVRMFAGRLRATLYTIPCYGLWAFLRCVPKRKVILAASGKLVFWSNAIFGGQPGQARTEVAALLNLPSD